MESSSPDRLVERRHVVYPTFVACFPVYCTAESNPIYNYVCGASTLVTGKVISDGKHPVQRFQAAVTLRRCLDVLSINLDGKDPSSSESGSDVASQLIDRWMVRNPHPSRQRRQSTESGSDVASQLIDRWMVRPIDRGNDDYIAVV